MQKRLKESKRLKNPDRFKRAMEGVRQLAREMICYPKKKKIIEPDVSLQMKISLTLELVKRRQNISQNYLPESLSYTFNQCI